MGLPSPTKFLRWRVNGHFHLSERVNKSHFSNVLISVGDKDAITVDNLQNLVCGVGVSKECMKSTVLF